MTAPWLSSMPAHWRGQPLGYLVRTMGGGTPAKEEPTYWSGGIPWVSPKDMKRPLIADSEDHVSQLALERTVLRLVPPPAVLVVVRGMILHHTFPVAETTVPVTLNQDMKALLPRSGIAARFLAYALRGLESALLSLVEEAGHGTRKVRTDLWRKFEMPVPPLDEQRAIADFLDEKTAAIDALITRKERLLALLDEKRQALITQAVTKGLDPSVKMKETGIEWLGKVPAHWIVSRLGREGRFFAGTGFPEAAQGRAGERYPFFKVGDFALHGNEWMLAAAENSIDDAAVRALRARVLPSGVVVFAKVGAALLLNRRRITTQPCLVDNNVIGYRPHIDLPEYVARWLQLVDLGQLANPGPVPSVNERSLREVPLLRPPSIEQARIVDLCTKIGVELDAVADRIARQVTLLREYRQGVITAAVTGKLDVRSKQARALEPAA